MVHGTDSFQVPGAPALPLLDKDKHTELRYMYVAYTESGIQTTVSGLQLQCTQVVQCWARPLWRVSGSSVNQDRGHLFDQEKINIQVAHHGLVGATSRGYVT